MDQRSEPKPAIGSHPLPGAFPDDANNIDELFASMNFLDHPRSPNLEGVRELNILVLGETGVGKSTFINAFANYIHYSSLDDAVEQEAVRCVIPTSFTW